MRTMWSIGVRDNFSFRVSGEEKEKKTSDSLAADQANADTAGERKYREDL